jgi:hypothetical protein
MSESYTDNHKEIDRIDRFVAENASIIALQIWAENILITNDNILSKCLEYIRMKNFTTSLDLNSTCYRAVFHGVVKQMALKEDEYCYPEYYFNHI